MRFTKFKEGIRRRYFQSGNMSLKPDFRCAYKQVDDCIIYADVYVPHQPPSGEKRRVPAILAIHGGAFILGHSDMVNKDQIADCLSRGWIVISLEHRLCPQVNILEGPITDCRDALAWVHDDKNGLDAELSKHDSSAGFSVDKDRVMAFGTSSGGAIALALGFSTPRPPAAILDFYGATNFTHAFWSSPLPTAPLPPTLYDESPVPIRGGVSLEGQSSAAAPKASASSSSSFSSSSTTTMTTNPSPPHPTDKPSQPPNSLAPRPSFAFTHIARGTLLRVCYPFGPLAAIDAVQNITPFFPPTCIVHGSADTMVPMHLSRTLFERLEENGVRREWIEVPGEEHTFVGKMTKGGEVWARQRKGFDWLERVISSS
ncbi:Alpha/Beta hydrolase protein [Macrophomina phaseolina]|uniref:Alpha/Beta hydrolase protein n=1 Tax=Macrophomina phaseolina TaxID=35725 RepID=A0ABQ8GEA5_9PEZI|nr:Alpha/Beta hydrolase protein [Macrophomina phaseolina]